MTEKVDTVVCCAIEEEYYQYLIWKKVKVIESVMGPSSRILERLAKGTVSNGEKPSRALVERFKNSCVVSVAHLVGCVSRGYLKTYGKHGISQTNALTLCPLPKGEGIARRLRNAPSPSGRGLGEGIKARASVNRGTT